jgi:hypothetical protein
MYSWRLSGIGGSSSSSSSSSSSITHVTGHGSTLLSLAPLPARSFTGQVGQSMHVQRLLKRLLFLKILRQLPMLLFQLRRACAASPRFFDCDLRCSRCWGC